ncbi:MAG: PP2C family protein-serine/threonine phosphatase [Lachnospiraceae bacterium]
MIGMQKQQFRECLDVVQVISKPARENFGEDSFYCAESNSSAIVSVFDGCGGLGARKYETFQGHTGAYIASRTVSGAIHDWYHKNYKKSWKDVQKLKSSIEEYIRKAYKVCEPYGVERLKIKGSMVRKFPTTLALAYAEYDGDGVLVHVLWAGDSRVYMLDENGLAQLTRDDTDVDDALENLMSDGAMTNVLSSDGNYRLNCKTIRLTSPALIFAATDGCFGYIPSPMEFEYVILKSLVENETPAVFKRALRTGLAQYAGDDLALGMMSFYYGDFSNTRMQFSERLNYLVKDYINPLNAERSEECTQRLWKDYKPEYERYLR